MFPSPTAKQSVLWEVALPAPVQNGCCNVRYNPEASWTHFQPGATGSVFSRFNKPNRA